MRELRWERMPLAMQKSWHDFTNLNDCEMSPPELRALSLGVVEEDVVWEYCTAKRCEYIVDFKSLSEVTNDMQDTVYCTIGIFL